MDAATFTPTASFTGAASISFTSNDGSTDSNTGVLNITVNDIPVMTAPSSPTIVNEDATNVALNDDINVADSDGDAQTVTIVVTNGIVTTGTTGITFGGTDGANSNDDFTISGTLAAINTALDAATFTPTPDYHGPASISLRSNDGVDSNTGVLNITVVSVNDDPTNSGSAATSPQTVLEDQASTIDLSNIVIADVDAGTGTLDLRIVAANAGEVITGAAGTGITFTGNSSDDVLISGNLTNLNNYLAGSNISFTTESNVNGTSISTLTLSIDDNGNTGSGGGTSQSLGSIVINATPVNDKPTMPALSDQTGNSGVSGFITNFISPGDVTLGPSDEETGGANEQTISTFNVTVSSDINGVISGTPSIVFNGSAYDLSWVANNNVSGTATISVTVTDDGGTTNSGVATSDPELFDITISDNQGPIATPSPANGSGAVLFSAHTNSVFITFDETTIANAGRYLRLSQNGSLVETVEVTDSEKVQVSGGNVYTFTFDKVFVKDSSYSISIDAGAFEDGLGNSFNTFSWSWTMQSSGGDFDYADIALTIPAHNATEISPNLTTLRFVFDEPVTLQNNDNNVDVHITSDTDPNYIGGVTYNTDTDQGADAGFSAINSTVTINSQPGSTIWDLDFTISGFPLQASTEYTVEIEEAAFEDQGNPTGDLGDNNFRQGSGSYFFSFTTSADGTPPVFDGTNSSPADAATVDLTSDVNSLTMRLFELTNGVVKGTGTINLYVNPGSPQLIESINVLSPDVVINDVGSGNYDVTINLSNRLSGSLTYFVQASAGSFEDGTGNEFVGISNTTDWQFTTDPDNNAPVEITANRYPLDNASNVDISNDFIMEFDEPVIAGTAGEIRLILGANNTVIETISLPTDAAQITSNGNSISIDWTNDLSGFTAYFVQIENGALTDNSGNTFAGFTSSQSWNFVTESGTDVTGPIVLNTSPVNGATNVDVSSNVVLTFNEAVSANSLGNIILNYSSATDDVIAANDPAITIVNNVVTIPNSLLSIPFGDADVDIELDANAFLDGGDVGNLALGAGNFTFATESDNQAPAILSLTPADDATGVVVTGTPISTLDITFDEIVNVQTGIVRIFLASDLSLIGSVNETAISGDGSANISIDISSINSGLREDREYYVFIPNGLFTDALGNVFPAFGGATGDWSFTSESDVTPPTVNISRNAVTSGSVTGGTADDPVSFTLTFNEEIDPTTFSKSDIQVTLTDVAIDGNGTSNTANQFSGSSVTLSTSDNITWSLSFNTITTTGVENGTIAISLLDGSFTDSNGVAFDAAGETNAGPITIDLTAPSTNSVTISSNRGSGSGALVGDDITLEFEVDETLLNDPVVTFTSGGGVINDAVIIDNTNAPIYTATYTVSTLDNSGIVAFTIDFTDLAGNDAGTVTTVSDFTSVKVDAEAPEVLSIDLTPLTVGTVNGTSQNNLTYTIVFSEAIDPATFSIADDIVLTGDGGVSVTSTSLTSGDQITWTLTLSGITGNGTFSFNIINNGTGTDITDGVGNTIPNESGATPNVIASTEETVVFDNNFPIINTLTPSAPSAGTVSNTNSDILSYTIVFSKPIDPSTFTLDQIRLRSTGTVRINGINPNTLLASDIGFEAGALNENVIELTNSGNNRNYTLSIGNSDGFVAGDGNLGITLIGSQIQDAADNYLGGGTGSNQLSTPDFVIDNTVPEFTAIELSSNNVDNQHATNGDVVTLKLSANDRLSAIPSVSFFSNDVAVQGTVSVVDDAPGTLTDFTATYTVDGIGSAGVDRDADGLVGFNIAFADDAGNSGVTINQTASSSETTDGSEIEVDTNVPTVTFSDGLADPSNLNPFTINANFDEVVTGLIGSDFTVSNGAITNITGTNPSFTLEITPSSPLDNQITIHLNASAVIDDAGNTNIQSADHIIDFDDIAPVITASASVQGRDLTLLAQLNEPGTLYYVVVADGVTVNSSEVKNVSGNAAGAVASGSIVFTSGGVNVTELISLDADQTDYRLYLVSEDNVDALNLLTTPQLISITSGGVSITAPSLSNICIDGDYFALGDIVITETIATDFRSSISQRTLLLELPDNFEFNSLVGSASVNATSDITIVSTSYNSSSTAVTIRYSVSGTANLDVMTITGLEVKVLSNGDGNIQDDNVTNAQIVRGGGSGDIYLANEEHSPVFASLTTIAPYNAPVVVTSITGLETQPYIIETDSVIFGDFLGDSVVVYDYGAFDDSRSPMTIGALTAGNEIRVYNNEDLDVSNLVLSENTVANRVVTVADLGLTQNDVGVNTFWITVTDGSACESAPAVFSVAIIRHENSSNTTAFSNEDQLGTTLRYTYPTGNIAFLDGDGLTSFNSNSDFSSPVQNGYSARYIPAAAGAGTDTVKFTLTNSKGQSANYWVKFLVYPTERVFEDTDIGDLGLCADELERDVTIYSVANIDFADTGDDADPDFHAIRIYEYSVTTGRGNLVSTDLLLNVADTLTVTTPTSRTGWTIDLDAALAHMTATEFSKTYEVVMFIADESTGNVSELASEEFTIYKNPEVSIANVNDYYCEDDESFNIQVLISSFDQFNQTFSISAQGYYLLKYNESDLDYTDTVRNYTSPATAVLNPQNLNGNVQDYLNEDETGRYKIVYTTAASPSVAGCISYAEKEFELLSKPDKPTLTNDLTNIGGLVETDGDGLVDDYVLEFVQGNVVPNIMADITTGDSIIWYNDALGSSALSSQGPEGSTITAETLFGTTTPNASNRTIYFAQRTSVGIDGSSFEGCESDLRKVQIIIRAIPGSVVVNTAAITADTTNATNLGTQVVSEAGVEGTGYIYEYCAAEGTNAVLEDLIITSGLNTDVNNPGESYFTLYDTDGLTELLQFTDPTLSGTVAPTLESVLSYTPEATTSTGSSKSFYISRTDFDNDPSNDGVEFNGCESDLRKFTIAVYPVPSAPLDDDFRGGENAASRQASETGNEITYYMCYGDQSTFSQLEAPNTAGAAFTWYVDDGTGTAPGAALNAAAFNDRLITLEELEDQLVFDDSVSGEYVYWLTQTTNDNAATDFYGCESEPTKVTVIVYPDPSTLQFDVNSSRSLEVSYCEGDLGDVSFNLVGNPNSTFRYYEANSSGQPTSAATALFGGAVDEDGLVNVTTSSLLLSNATQGRYHFLISQINDIAPNDSDFTGCESEISDMAFLTVNVYDIPNAPRVVGDSKRTIFFNEDSVIANGITVTAEPSSIVRWYRDEDADGLVDGDPIFRGVTASSSDLGLDGVNGASVERFIVTQVADSAAGASFVGCESNGLFINILQIPDMPVTSDPSSFCEDEVIPTNVSISYYGLSQEEGVSQFNWYDGANDINTFATTQPTSPENQNNTFVRDWARYIELNDPEGLGVTHTVYVSQQIAVPTNSQQTGAVVEGPRSPVTVVFYPRPEIGRYSDDGVITAFEVIEACNNSLVTLNVRLENVLVDDAIFSWRAGQTATSDEAITPVSMIKLGDYEAQFALDPSGLGFGDKYFEVRVEDNNRPADLGGCYAEAGMTFEIGTSPIPKLRWEGITEGRPTTLVFGDDNTNVSANYWVDSIHVDIPGANWSMGVNFDQGTVNRNNLLTIDSVIFQNSGEYIIDVTYISGSACVGELSKTITILDHFVVTDNITFGFDGSDDGDWFAEYTDGFEERSLAWEIGSSSFDGNDNGNGSFWVTGDGDKYSAGAESWVYSPSFDLSGMTNPTVGFSHIRDLNFTDGVVLQQSTDDGRTWRPVGSFQQVSESQGLGSGKNWYNTEQISGAPGDEGVNFNPRAFAWSNRDDDPGWVVTAHRITELHRFVRFRFALGSTQGDKVENDNVSPQDGFAFDDFSIYNKEKFILIEQFSDFTTTSVRAADSVVSRIQHEIATDAILLNYYVGNSNIAGRTNSDPAARSTYYGVSTAPQSIVSGTNVENEEELSELNDVTGWNVNYYNSRALDQALFDIGEISLGSDPSSVDLSTTFTYSDQGDFLPEGTELSFRFAIVEKEINDPELVSQNGGKPLRNVLRKMLPSTGGFTYKGVVTPGQTVFFNGSSTIEASWGISDIYDVDQLMVIAFVQVDNLPDSYTGALVENKLILQAKAVDVTGKIIPAVTGVTPISKVDQFAIYPNPANRSFKVQLEKAPTTEMDWIIYDQVGRQVRLGAIKPGELEIEIDSNELPSGVYLIHFFNDEVKWLPKRLVIIH